ncbi:Hsp20/alpha crystallin family protein [Histomonas meleagridis]|uniref:Hsp20/alpha crystallin family protein n=1 Tax=Histomonas meleagridis TaxID=135588 RepID=UPI00355A8947|nr:Hsp20/alpha crystallin family protein [Histomonas meleagridis]KAH0799096.1 Hsp20/alpha crystallin family protein [Histomonas meleagridis]
MLSCLKNFNRGFFSMPYYPLADVFQTKKGYEIQMELPGVKKDDITIDLDQGILNITATKKLKKDESVKQIHTEIEYGTISREFNLPSNVETEGMEAVLKDGVLTLSIPRKEKSKVEVKIL